MSSKHNSKRLTTSLCWETETSKPAAVFPCRARVDGAVRSRVGHEVPKGIALRTPTSLTRHFERGDRHRDARVQRTDLAQLRYRHNGRASLARQHRKSLFFSPDDESHRRRTEVEVVERVLGLPGETDRQHVGLVEHVERRRNTSDVAEGEVLDGPGRGLGDRGEIRAERWRGTTTPVTPARRRCATSRRGCADRSRRHRRAKTGDDAREVSRFTVSRRAAMAMTPWCPSVRASRSSRVIETTWTGTRWRWASNSIASRVSLASWASATRSSDLRRRAFQEFEHGVTPLDLLAPETFPLAPARRPPRPADLTTGHRSAPLTRRARVAPCAVRDVDSRGLFEQGDRARPDAFDPPEGTQTLGGRRFHRDERPPRRRVRRTSAA